jgi:hypothetical protein
MCIRVGFLPSRGADFVPLNGFPLWYPTSLDRPHGGCADVVSDSLSTPSIGGSARRLARTGTADNLLVALFAICAVFMKVLAILRYRFDSDEPQHLHVAWGWTAGLLQYRDVFDNHAPLFHILTAPILAAFGERADILIYMRCAMLPLLFIALWATWEIARRTWGSGAANWSVLLLALFPPFFLKSLEYRTDNLWDTIWIVALLVVLRPSTDPRQWFLVGSLLGVALSVSLKTPLLIVTLGVCGGIVAATQRGLRPRIVVRCALSALAGFVIVPSCILLYFWHRGALGDLWYCTIAFNSAISDARPERLLLRILYPAGLFVIARVALRRARGSHVASERFHRRLLLLLMLPVYTLTLLCLWPLVSPRDFLPLIPVLAIVTAGVAEESFRAGLPTSRYATVMSALILVEIAASVAMGTLWKNSTRLQIAETDQVLHLTTPADPIMDIKGETIFRRRPFYYVFEFITREQMRRGLIQDHIAMAVMRARCHVAQADGPFFPQAGRRFLNENFVDVGRLRVAGQFLEPDGTFRTAIPGEYLVVTRTGAVSGVLDGKPVGSGLQLVPGVHRFIGATRRAAAMWAPAFRRGFSPFHHRGIV